MTKTVTVTVPATTANLGPGFDCIGAALTLYNQFKFTCVDSAGSFRVSIAVTGAEAQLVKTDESNLLYQAFVRFYEHLGQMPSPVQIEILLGVPLARGLGSSATAIVGGLVGANHLAGTPLNERQVMELAIALEGHPDNVVPALLGGCRLAAMGFSTEPQGSQSRGGEPRPLEGTGVRGGRRGEEEGEGFGGWEVCDVPWHPDVVPVVAIPNFELETQEARRVLPVEVSRMDAIFNTAHLGLLLRGLETGRVDWLRVALQDRLHQPYRLALIPGYEAVRQAAMAAGALGMVISGAGPTLLSLVNPARAADVEMAMGAAWQDQGVTAQVRSLSIEPRGAMNLTV